METTNGSYLTLERDSREVLYKDRGSKFLGFAYRVADEEGISQRLSEIREEHPSANHHCYAWMLGPENQEYRVNDDGEPSGSAGNPILGQIRSKELNYVLVVVVRYFGGTKLGVGGLIQAYKNTASLTLEQAGRRRVWRTRTLEVRCGYPKLNQVMRIVKREKLHILEQRMEVDCLLKVAVRLADSDRIFEELAGQAGIAVSRT